MKIPIEWVNARAFFRMSDQYVAFTNGCFDVWHAGHVHLLRTIHEMYPLHLIFVGLNTDRSVRKLKGPSRPVNCFEHRRAVLQACRYVDCVIPFNQSTPEKLVRYLQPDVLVKDAGYRGKYVAGAEYMAGYGGKVVFVEPLEGISTTEILAKGAKKRRGR